MRNGGGVDIMYGMYGVSEKIASHGGIYIDVLCTWYVFRRYSLFVVENNGGFEEIAWRYFCRGTITI